MTLETQVPRVIISGNGTRGPYSLVDGTSQAIRFVSTSHIRLVRYDSTTDEDGTTLSLNTDYTVGGTQDARTFTLTSGQEVLTSSQRIVADRVQGYNQDLSLSNGGSFGAVALMNRLDKQGEYLQELKARADRSLKSYWSDTTERSLPLPPTSGTALLGQSSTGALVHAAAADFGAGTAVDDSWLDLFGLTAAEGLGWYNVRVYGAVGDGATDDTTAIHLARTAAGVGGIVYFPSVGDGLTTYIVAGLQANIDDQTWIVAPGAKLKMKASSVLNMVVVSGDRFKLIGELDGNRTNAPSGGMITIDTGVEDPEFDVYCYESSSYSIFSTNNPRLKIKGRFVGGTSTPIYARLNAAVANVEGPMVDVEVDLSDETAATYNHPCIIIRGIEGGGYRFDNVSVRVRSKMPDDPTNSTNIHCEVKAANNVHIDAECQDGAMGISLAEVTVAAGTVNAKGFNHYGVEYGGGCVDCHFDGALDGRDASGANQCLYPLAFQGSPSGGVGYNKNCSFSGPLHGATSSQSILFDNCIDCWFQGVVNCGASNYVAYDDGQGYFSLDGIFNGETGGDLLVYSLNSTGRFTVTGRAKAFDNGGAQIEANTAITIDFVSMQVLYEDANGGGIATTLSGGAALGENVTAHGCAGQFFGGSSYRGQVLNLKRALYNIEGTGPPEGTVTAGVGSLYTRADGADGTILYIKSTGTGNTGWDAVPYYEEGTFNATVTFATPGDLSVSYSTQAGTYTRRGNRVEIDVSLGFTPTFTTAAGQLRIGGLPFTIGSSQATAGTVRDITAGFTWPASRTQVVAVPISSQTYCTIQCLGSAQNPSDMSASNMTSASAHTLRFSASYRI